jgi:small redox-active disulfide protein 2
MPKDQEIEMIIMSGRQVGIVGLRSILQQVASLGLADEKQITARLIERVKACNYVPDSAEAEYGKALLRAYRSRLGQKVDVTEQVRGLVIRILGPGCLRCDQLTREVRNALAELGLVADVEHVRDPEFMAKYGFISTPALVINGRVRSSGRLPSREKTRIWLQELRSSQTRS